MAIVQKPLSGTVVGSNVVYQTNATYSPAQLYYPNPGDTVTLDLSTSNKHRIQLSSGNITIAISNATVDQNFMIELIQDATGSRTVTWFTTIKWAGGSAPTLTTTASKKDRIGFTVTGTGTYDGTVIDQNI